MKTLVAGGAGFICGKFVLDWLPQSQEPVLNLDKLTCAGNLQTPASKVAEINTPYEVFHASLKRVAVRT